MGTLKEDIKKQSEWIVVAFALDNYKLDYSIESLMEIDRFFKDNMKNGKPKKGGRLAKPGFGPILFSIGSYLGETIIKNVPGTEWITDDNDPKGELNVRMKLPNETIFFPINRVMNRFQNGSEDSIYPYAHILTKEYTNQDFNKEFWNLIAESEEMPSKPWWKFW